MISINGYELRREVWTTCLTDDGRDLGEPSMDTPVILKRWKLPILPEIGVLARELCTDMPTPFSEIEWHLGGRVSERIVEWLLNIHDAAWRKTYVCTNLLLDGYDMNLPGSRHKCACRKEVRYYLDIVTEEGIDAWTEPHVFETMNTGFLTNLKDFYKYDNNSPFKHALLLREIGLLEGIADKQRLAREQRKAKVVRQRKLLPAYYRSET